MPTIISTGYIDLPMVGGGTFRLATGSIDINSTSTHYIPSQSPSITVTMQGTFQGSVIMSLERTANIYNKVIEIKNSNNVSVYFADNNDGEAAATTNRTVYVGGQDPEDRTEYAPGGYAGTNTTGQISCTIPVLVTNPQGECYIYKRNFNSRYATEAVWESFTHPTATTLGYYVANMSQAQIIATSASAINKTEKNMQFDLWIKSMMGYAINYNLIHAIGSPTNPTIQSPGDYPSIAYFTPDTNYRLTDNSVTITYGAPDYDPFDDFTFDGIQLRIGEISGEIIVTVRAVPIPYEGGGTSETGGGEGTFGDDRFGDGIDDETIDTPDYDPLDQFNRSVLGSQFVDVYAPSRTELQSLKNYLWSSSISDTLKKMFNNPMDCIVTLHMVPVSVPSTASNIFVGGSDTGIASSHVTNQYVTVNCGSMSIGEYWDAYLDYSPYTKMFLYLPFCGMHEIDVDEVMGQTISIRYDVDVVSGDCLCSISATRSGGMSTVLYQYAGNCSVEIPVSMANYNARVSAYLGLVGSAAGVVAGVASGGMSAPLAATALASSAANIATAKKSIQRSGAIAGSTAWMSQLKPYFILVQPSQCLPDNQAHFTGYPSFITAAVGELSGYTEFAEIHLEGISATDSEKAEIETILKGGVLI